MMKTISKIFLWSLRYIVLFGPGITYAAMKFPLLIKEPRDEYAIGFGFILFAVFIVVPILTKRMRLFKYQTFILIIFFLIFLFLNTILVHIVWLFGVTVIGSAIEEFILTPLYKHLYKKGIARCANGEHNDN